MLASRLRTTFLLVVFIAPMTAPSLYAQEPASSASNSEQKDAQAPEDPSKSIKALLAPSVAFLVWAKDEHSTGFVSTALVIREDGLLLASYDYIRTAKHVQVRLPHGDVFNRVELVSYDEPRHLAVLKISASNLTPARIAAPDEPKPGEKISVISSAWGSDIRVLPCLFKDSVPGEVATTDGKGLSFLEISSTDWLAPGQIAVDSQGRVLGLIVDSIYRYRNFASPLTKIEELLSKPGGTVLGSGAGLHTSSEIGSEKGPELSASSLATIARRAHTIRLESRTDLIPVEPVTRKLLENPDFTALGLVVVKDDYSSDLTITLDRPLFTWDFTYAMTDRRTQAILGSGKVIAWDGVRAAPSLAAQIVKRLKTYREQGEGKAERRDPEKN